MPRRSKRGKKSHSPPPIITLPAPSTGFDLASVNTDLLSLATTLCNKMKLPANRPAQFMETLCEEIDDMVNQAFGVAGLEFLAGEGSLADRAQHIAYTMIFGRTLAEKQQRKEYLQRLLAGASQGLNNSSHQAASATPPPEDIKVLVKNLENNYARLKRDMGELNKMMKEFRQKLDVHHDKLTGFQQSQSKDIPEC
ncbi:hypothetical protein L211DRAFT_876850 [Terfezia boudieri ATCC MYA-4762]|uniref:Uncharacterized protein n=1 Tax=Terfezia boudieri ATCC MYA-4762 TaxID=1051890 RepID=A0A3N4LQE9_9PEZI|nr:hypothetical protein L211DRAFT_876850 [Terfezia boudieri ATCC MYA-4762]